MKIFGVDPGMAITGWGIVTEEPDGSLQAISYGAVVTSARMETAKRLKIIRDRIDELLAEHQPDVVAIEKLFFIHNTTARLGVGQSRGVVLCTVEERGIPSVEYAPKVIKRAITGYGGAGKDQVSHMIKALLKLASVPKPDDVTDALAVAVCHAQSYRMLNIGAKA